MEETLGKRIVANRKRIGLTQDQLAERVGVTAQAVSKWENDQSCPDIATLPKLALIFGITTDALLGMERSVAVRKAELVEEDENPDHKDLWELRWDPGKKEGLTIAILVLLVGVLTLLSKVQQWDVSFWSILWPSALLVYGMRGLLPRFSFFNLGCALFGGYYLLSNLNIWKLDISSELIFPIIIVLFGLSLLVDALCKPKKSKFHFSRNGVKLNHNETKRNFSTGVDSFETDLAFGQDTHIVTLNVLEHGDIDCCFGSLTVDLRDCKQVSEDCGIDADCSFGSLELLVPKRFFINLDRSVAFGSIEIQGQPDNVPEGSIQLDADVSFGHIEIHYL